MPRPKDHVVRLSAADRAELTRVVSRGTHPGTHRTRPRSARFEPVSPLKGRTLRWFLAYSSPSRSPDPHHLAVLARPDFC